MNSLAILSEDSSDDVFYEACAERITGLSFHLHDPLRIRRGGGISAVRRSLPAFLNDLKGLAQTGPSYFIIAIDNDRAPEHPGHERIPGLNRRDESKGCRVCELSKTVESVFGKDRSTWPAQGALTVPIEMLESWILIGSGSDPETLPIFSRQKDSSANAFYNGNPPPQLKDLLKHRSRERAIPEKELLLEVADEMDLELVCSQSPSFADFFRQIENWESEHA